MKESLLRHMRFDGANLVLGQAGAGHMDFLGCCGRASLIAEGANYPVTPAADEILADRGVRVIPDILANGGGVTGSYFEWTQNIQQFQWKEDRFNMELRDRLTRAYTEVAGYAERHDCTYRRAAYAIALERVAHAVRLRGYV